MKYDHIDPVERARQLSVATGLGDLSAFGAADAITAERSAVILELRVALFSAHAASNDPDAAAFGRARDAMEPEAKKTRQAADRITKATGQDVSGIRSEVYAPNEHKAESDYFDAEWRMENDPNADPNLTLVCERAERELAVLKGKP